MVKRILQTWNKIKRGMLKSDMERYLEQSQSVADLEYRIKIWNNRSHRNRLFSN